MQITETSAEGLKRAYKITIPAEDLSGRVEERLKEITKTIRMPGFRPGKVPLSLVRKQYGRALLGEILEQAVQDSSAKVLEDNNLRPATQPNITVDSFDEGAALEYSMTVELLPEIEPTDFSAVAVEKLVIAAEPARIDETLENIAKGRRETVVVERPAQAGDQVVVDYVGSVGDEQPQALRGDDRSIEVGGEAFFNAFDGKLVGVTAGEQLTVEVTLPDNFAVEEVAGKVASFAITVKEVREPQALAIDDEFAKSLGFEDLEKLREIVKAGIESDYAQLTRTRLKRDLFDKLDAVHQFELPPGMVDSEFEAIWKRVQEEFEQNGSKPEDEGKTEEQLQGEYRTIAQRRVRLGLLLAEVGRRASIEVSQEELGRAVMAEAQRYPQAAKQVIDYYRKNPQAAEMLRAPLFEEKVVDHILTLVQLTERASTVEELTNEDETAVA
jgi:trigger factor